MSEERVFQRHQQNVYFQNVDMDFYFLWVLAYQSNGGANRGECFDAASRIKDGDPKSWVKVWDEVAKRVETQAAKALEKGHQVSARKSYLRAFTYYRAVVFCLGANDAQYYETWQKLRSCFQKAGTLFVPPIQRIEIPYQGKVLSGYFMRVDDSGEKHPTLIAIGGGEIFAEDLYFLAGMSGVCRGYNVVLVDLPGQGSAVFAGLIMRADTEVPIKAVVDYALNRPDVDANRLALYGISGGSYMAARAVAFEKRIKACIVNSPIFDLYRLLTKDLPPILLKAPAFIGDAVMKLTSRKNPIARIVMERLCWQAGVNKLFDFLERTRAATLEGVVSEIACPMLCLVGAAESEEAIAQARQLYDALCIPNKTLRIFMAEEGADAHCQLNNLSLQHQVVFDWLDEVFA